MSGDRSKRMPPSELFELASGLVRQDVERTHRDAVYDAAMEWFQNIEIQRGDAYEHNLLAELEQACRRAKEGR